MDARLQFQWNADKAKRLVDDLQNQGHFGPGFEDIAPRDDAEYEIFLNIKMKQKRKSRKKEGESKGLDL